MKDSIFFYRNPETATANNGRLQGMKIAIQPNMSVAGWPTEAGSKALANYKALEDSTIIRRLLQAGAHLCGSTIMSEFGLGLQGSQAGEALKKSFAEAELVLDIMGESRVAASRAAVCGFKPSYGLLSRLGIIGLIPSMECCGILSGSLEKIRDILRAVAGPDELDFSQPDEKTPDFSAREVDLKKIKAGIIGEAQASLTEEQKKSFQKEAGELAKAGLALKEISLPEYSLFSVVHKIAGSVEASSCAGRYDSVRYGQRAPGAKNWNEMYLQSRGAAFNTLVKSFLFQGAYFQFERYRAYEDACRIRARLVADMQRSNVEADFLIFPMPAIDSSASTSLADTYRQFDLTLFANVTGQPVLYLPPEPGTNRSGIQLTGPRLSDAGLLALGEHLLNLRKGGK